VKPGSVDPSSPRPLRIWFLLNSLNGGGAEGTTITLANALGERGHDVALVVPDGGGVMAERVTSRVRVLDLGGSRWRFTWQGLRRRGIEDGWPDLVLPTSVETAVAARLALPGSGRARLVPVVHSLLPLDRGTGIERRLRRLLWTWALRQAFQLVCVSDGIRGELVQRFGFTTPMVVIPNPVPPAARRTPTSAPTTTNDALGGARILWVGRMAPEKNLDRLLRVFVRLQVQLPGAKLVLVGDGSERRRIMEVCERNPVLRGVEFHGWLRDPWTVGRDCDVLVLTSDREGLPTVILEAWDAGLPVVSVDCPSGPGEMIGDGPWGSVVPPEDEGGMVEALVRFVALRRQGWSVPEEALRAFRPEVVALRYEALAHDGG